MPELDFDRRTFLRLASFAALGVAAACSKGKPNGTLTPTPTGKGTSGSSPTPSAPSHAVSWHRIGVPGPKPRSYHTFTANADGSIVFLFGGKTKGRIYKDAWAFERANRLWQPLPYGPEPRYGHNAAFVGGHLLIYGGQAGSHVFDDTWSFDPIHGTWVRLRESGARPVARVGASGTTIANSLTISHGLTQSGLADDSWARSTHWINVTPKGGPRPAKRAFHRAVYVVDQTRMVLFGGSAGGSLLNDTWLYDPTILGWTQAETPGPAPRNLFAAGATKAAAYLYGGGGRGRVFGDAWSFDGQNWHLMKPKGSPPGARSGIEGAIVSGPSMLVFGGNDGAHDLDDLWELTLPV